MWDLANAGARQIKLVEEYLGKGYEPFAVSADSFGFVTIWFKKQIGGINIEVHSESTEPDKRTSSRATRKPKGKTSS